MAEWDDYALFWKETLNLIRNEKDEKEFALWFNLEYLRAAENTITIGVPSAFYQTQLITRHYKEYIESKLKELTGKDIALALEVKPRTVPAQTDREKAADTGGTGKNPGVTAVASTAAPDPKTKPDHAQLNKDYTFEKYVIGDNNSFAANAAIAIARNPGTAYNPFLIYGGVGLGKTHLMQAIGNYIHTNSDSKIIYINAETFTNEFIRSTQENKMTAFKNKYRYVDALLIDDIHFLQSKPGSQEELYYTYEALYNAKKQIIFTCDRPVSELKNLTDRLRSRFERGLNVDLQPPNYETRCAILKKKVEATNVTIPEEVIALVSKNISTNIRDLESSLTKLIAYADLVGKPITLETAQQQLKDVFASPKQANMSIEIIQRVAADFFSQSPNDLKGKKKTQNIVFPRQIAMYICREITEYSTTEIGQAFGGRDHTTVMHSCQKIEERIRADPTLDSTLQKLIRMIKESSARA